MIGGWRMCLIEMAYIRLFGMRIRLMGVEYKSNVVGVYMSNENVVYVYV